MILKRGSNTTYGIPYQGSKTKIIDQISRFFPNADHFYDLFGGGFSVTHFMMIYRKNSYKHFHFNEVRPGICDLIQDAINGKYSYDNFKPEWISKETFLKEKDSNPYIKIIWSFGNNGNNYLFGKDIENQKRSMHMAVVFDQFDDFMLNTFGINKWPNDLDITGKRIYLRKIYANKKLRGDLQQLEQLERLQQLEQLEQLEQLSFTSLDYRQVNVESNSVIYCDIPYKNTEKYDNEFNHDEFFEWANSQTNPVFISEYNIDDDRFYLLKKFSHRSTFSNRGDKNIPVVEKLYGNKIAYEIIKDARDKKINPTQA